MEQKKRLIGFEMRTVNNLIKRYVQSKKPPELDSSTGVHGWALRFFYENRGRDIFQRDFEERFSIRRSTATNMLKLMEKNGLIERFAVDYDARLKKIVLTEKAIDIHKRIVKSIDGCERMLSQGISPQELDIFFSTIDKIKANLEVAE